MSITFHIKDDPLRTKDSLNCYARRVVGRFPAVHGGDDFSIIRPHLDRMKDPLRWRRGRRVFVCSMGDLFNLNVPDDLIALVWGTMAACPHHTFQILTKRPGRMKRWLEQFASDLKDDARNNGRDELPLRLVTQAANAPWPLPNVWLGVTAETQGDADERIPLLLESPAALRFVSVEPMLGLVYLDSNEAGGLHALGLVPVSAPKIDWVICGAESGPGHRPTDLDWVRVLRNQCAHAGVPFFLKQLEDERGHIVKMPALDGFLPETLCIASGQSPRGDFMHSVIYRGGSLVHDPHPDGAGLRGAPRDVIVLVPRDPTVIRGEAIPGGFR